MGYLFCWLKMLLDPTKTKYLILLCHPNKMPQAFLEFFGAMACSINEGDADPDVGG